MSAPPSRLARAAVALWIAAQGVMLVRAALPLPRPWGGRVPWRMFTSMGPYEPTIAAAGTTTAGAELEIPLDRWFQFTRGATGQRACDLSLVLLTPGHTGERAAFARWLAAQMAGDGVQLREVRLIRRDLDLRTGEVRVRTIGRFEVDDGAS